MRQPIETAPRNGKDIFVEDDQGALDVAHWSSEANEWVWKNGKPIRITPTHWRPITKTLYQEDEKSSSPLQVGRERRRFTTSLIAATLVAAVLIGMYFRSEMVAFATRYRDGTEVVRARDALDGLKQETSRSDARAGELAAERSELDTEVALANKVGDEAVQAAATTADLQQSLDQERERSAALASELAKVRIDLGTTVALPSKSHDEAVQRRQVAEVAAEELRQSLQQERARAAALASELAGTRREVETQAIQSQKVVDEAVQQKQTAEAATAELREALQQEQKKTAALTQEAGTARQATTASAEQQRRALEEAQAHAAALASELAGTRREIEIQAAQSQKAVDEAVQQKQTAEAATAELREALQQEQKTAALTEEVGAAPQAMTAGAEQQRRSLDEVQAQAAALASELVRTRREIETHATQSQKVVDEAVPQKQTAESTIAELRWSLQQERDKIGSMARDLAPARRPRDHRATPRRAQDGPISPIHQVRQTTGPAVTKQPIAADAQDKTEAARLIARASALLSQGNIGAARIVLERATESGNAQASFMLAETYDPVILSAWGTYGTRGEAARARELYSKAHTGGIREAKDRLDALRQ